MITDLHHVFWDSGHGMSTPEADSDKQWAVLVELARAFVRFADETKGENCDVAMAHVSGWGTRRPEPDQPIEMRYVNLTFSMPAKRVDGVLRCQGILPDEETDLEKAQRLRFSLLELE